VPKNDPFTISLKEDIKHSGHTLPGAAEAINKSWSQFRREIRGKTKIGIMPVETVAALKQEECISEETVLLWFEEVRSELRFKGKKKDRTNVAAR